MKRNIVVTDKELVLAEACFISASEHARVAMMLLKRGKA